MKKFFLLLIVALQTGIAYSQKNRVLRLDDDCMLDNSILLTEIIQELDSSFIRTMFEENCKMILTAEVDTNGMIIKIDEKSSLMHSNVIFPYDFIQSIEDYAKSKSIRFSVCYQYEPGMTLDKIKAKFPHKIRLGIPSMMFGRYYKYLEDKNIYSHEY